MSILEKIITQKRLEVEERQSLYPTKLLERSPFFETACVSLTDYLQREESQGIIAEFKRRSPSKGFINRYANIEEISLGYMQAGASALSVLTDSDFFGGSSKDLSTARKFNYCPILRKEFIIDEYQVIEAKSIGADAILLIAAVLTEKECFELAQTARQLGMEVLLEVHNRQEAERYPNDQLNLIGVNNRKLENFSVTLDTSHQLSAIIPPEFLKISESGIHSVRDIQELRESGYQGFLMGERFMREAHPALACARFIDELKLHEKLPRYAQ